MKPSMPITLAAILALAAPSTLAASGTLKERAAALSKANRDSVLYVNALVSLEITAGSNPPQKEEKKTELVGTVLNKDGLIVVPLSSLDVSSAMDGRTVNTAQGPLKLSVKAEIKEVKIIMPDGSEVAAKIALKDDDLDLAFLRPEKPGAVFTPVDAKNNARMAALDDVIILGRLGKDLNREPFAATSEIIAVVSKPRVFGKCPAQSLGLPIFNSEGKFLGIGVNRFSAKASNESQPSASNVILPAADLLESASQVK